MIPTYIISLPDHKHKREKLIDQLIKNGIEKYEIINPFDGRKMNFNQFPDYERILRLSLYGKDLVGPEFGCFLSHKKIYQKMINENISYALVLEDDAKLNKNFSEVLGILLNKYPELDLVRFLGKYKLHNKPKRKILQLTKDASLIRLHGSPGGTYAYVISQLGAKKMLSKMNKIFTAIDTLMGLQFITGIDILTIDPKIATWDDDLGTTIGSKRYEKNLRGIYRVTYPITRFIFKVIEENSKLYFYYKNFWRDNKRFKSSATLKNKEAELK